MKNKFILLLLISQSTLFTNIKAQSVGISAAGVGSFTPNAAAILDISSTSLGFLIPQTSTLPTTLTAAAQGLLFYNTSSGANFLYVNNSSTNSPSWASLPNGTITNILGLSTGVNITSTLTNGGATYTSNVLSLSSAISTVAWSLTNGNSIVGAPLAPSTYGTYGTSSIPTGNFLGTSTSSAKDFVLVANSIERMRILNASKNVGIGTAAPVSTLEVNGTFGSFIGKEAYGTSSSPSSANYILYFSAVNTYGSTILYIPAANTCANRRYLIVNAQLPNNDTKVSPGYYPIGSSTLSTTVTNSTSVEIISDGSVWRQIL